MHRERVLKLADHLEGLRTTKLSDWDGYCQESWVHHCGTPACIAGHAAALSQGGDWVSWNSSGEIALEATRWLGLTGEQSDGLFVGRPFIAEQEPGPTAADAAATLRHLAETGEMCWRRAFT